MVASPPSVTTALVGAAVYETVGAVGTAPVVTVSRNGIPGGPQTAGGPAGSGVPTGVGEGDTVGVGEAVGLAVAVAVTVPGAGVAVGVTSRSTGMHVGEKKPLVAVTWIGTFDIGILITASTPPEQLQTDPGGKPAPLASVPVAGSDPSVQLTPDFNITCPCAETVKKHGVPRRTAVVPEPIGPPHAPCG
jgi:hypothetical protein